MATHDTRNPGLRLRPEPAERAGDAAAGRDVTAHDQRNELQAIAGTAEHAALIGNCIGRLGIFRLSRQLTVIETILRRPARVS